MEDKFAFLDNMNTWLLDNGMELFTNIIVSVIILIAAKIVG